MSDTARAVFPDPPVELDLNLSPACLVPPGMLQREGRPWKPPVGVLRHEAREVDAVLRFLTASDVAITARLARALGEVKKGRLYLKEGHARWLPYLNAFVKTTPRWVQYELRRERELKSYPKLEEAYRQGAITRSHVRVALSRVSPETEDVWLARCRMMTVRQLEAVAREEKVESSESETAAPPARRRRRIAAPAGVAVMLAEGVELARKVAGHHIREGEAVAMMAAELLSGLPLPASSAKPGPLPDRAARKEERPASPLGDHEDLRRELGRSWESAHEQMERWSRLWAELPKELPAVVLKAAPPDCDDPHRRVVFWSGVRGKLDAVRGRLLRVVEGRYMTDKLTFAGMGQYVRERMGLSYREARDLIRLDRALEDTPLAFAMYAAGRLGRRAAWLVTRVARLGQRDTEREWVRFAMTHTQRVLEAAVEAMLLMYATDRKGWLERKNLPPEGASFGEVLRACSYSKGSKSVVTIGLGFYPDEEAVYEAALGALEALTGQKKPEWYWLAVMVRHYLDMYADSDEGLKKTTARKVIIRDNYTCTAPECLERGGLEADHIVFRSRGGPGVLDNLTSLCGAHHRHVKHEVGSLRLRGEAPEHLVIEMGGEMGARVYRKDRLISPAFREEILDENPWQASPAPPASSPAAPAP